MDLLRLAAEGDWWETRAPAVPSRGISYDYDDEQDTNPEWFGVVDPEHRTRRNPASDPFIELKSMQDSGNGMDVAHSDFVRPCENCWLNEGLYGARSPKHFRETGHTPMDLPRYVAATKSKAKPKERKPEDVWYDVHKHPEGTPGGMGKAPEHHLRNRGWQPHEIHEGSGKKTIQYRNHGFPDFVVSYGGGTGAKPDHNFRVLYIGTNHNIPKVTQAYSVAEAMNKVEELQQLESGHVVQPLIHGAATKTPYTPVHPPPSRQPKQFVAPDAPANAPVATPGYQIGPKQQPDKADTPEPEPVPNADPQLKQIPVTPGPDQKSRLKWTAASGPPRAFNDHGTLGGIKREYANGVAPCDLCGKAQRVWRKDPGLYRELVDHSGGLTPDHLHTSSEFHDRIMDALRSRGTGGPGRRPDGQGPADLGRTQYFRNWKAQRQLADDTDVAQIAKGYGMEIAPEEVRNYPGLRGLSSLLKRAQQRSWEQE